MEILNETGDKEDFSDEKLCQSILRAGAERDLADKVCKAVEKDLRPGETTGNIFRAALRLITKESRALAARYSVKRAVAELGPAGFVFEQYVEVVLRAYGFHTRRNLFIEGACGVEYEIDVLAEMAQEHYLVEAKYHNAGGVKTDVNTLLYAYARGLDIAERMDKTEGKAGKNHKHGLWLITNTKFTESAVKYGKCKKIKMTGWSYPKGESLEERIIEKKLYPITVLPSINKRYLSEFARYGMLLAQDLLPYSADDLSRKFGISTPDADKIKDDVKEIAA